MAVITVTEILGGDNLAGSRITINDNFKKITNAINTLETRLDTSFVPGGSLNVGNALIKKYTNPTSAQIFDCEATGQFQGNLNVLLDASVTQSISAGLDITAGRNVNFTGSSGSGTFLSSIFSEFRKGFAITQLGAQTAAAPTLNPQTLTPAGATSRPLTASLVGYSVLRLDLSTYNSATSDNCEEISLPAVGVGATLGQVITIIIDQVSPAAIGGGFKISNTNFDPGYTLPIAIGVNLFGTDDARIKKVAVTLFADAAGWRVLNIAQPNVGATPDVTY